MVASQCPHPIFPYIAIVNIRTSCANNSLTTDPNASKFDREAQYDILEIILKFEMDYP